jgi:hypothetical protein
MCRGQVLETLHKKMKKLIYPNLLTVAVAIEAIPSSLPVNPNFSDVVAFTLIRFISNPIIREIEALISPDKGPIFGCSQMIVQSTLLI